MITPEEAMTDCECIEAMDMLSELPTNSTVTCAICGTPYTKIPVVMEPLSPCAYVELSPSSFQKRLHAAVDRAELEVIREIIDEAFQKGRALERTKGIADAGNKV